MRKKNYSKGDIRLPKNLPLPNANFIYLNINSKEHNHIDDFFLKTNSFSKCFNNNKNKNNNHYNTNKNKIKDKNRISNYGLFTKDLSNKHNYVNRLLKNSIFPVENDEKVIIKSNLWTNNCPINNNFYTNTSDNEHIIKEINSISNLNNLSINSTNISSLNLNKCNYSGLYKGKIHHKKFNSINTTTSIFSKSNNNLLSYSPSLQTIIHDKTSIKKLYNNKSISPVKSFNKTKTLTNLNIKPKRKTTDYSNKKIKFDYRPFSSYIKNKNKFNFKKPITTEIYLNNTNKYLVENTHVELSNAREKFKKELFHIMRVDGPNLLVQGGMSKDYLKISKWNDPLINCIHKDDKNLAIAVSTNQLRYTKNILRQYFAKYRRQIKVIPNEKKIKWKLSLYYTAQQIKGLGLKSISSLINYNNLIPFKNDSFNFFFSVKVNKKSEFFDDMTFENNKLAFLDFDQTNKTILHWIIIRNRYSLISFAVSNGAFIDARDIQGRTPLHIACENSNLKAIMILLFLMANPFLKDYHDRGCEDFLNYHMVKNENVNNTIKYIINRCKMLHKLYTFCNCNLKKYILYVQRGLFFVYANELHLNFNYRDFGILDGRIFNDYFNTFKCYVKFRID